MIGIVYGHLITEDRSNNRRYNRNNRLSTCTQMLWDIKKFTMKKMPGFIFILLILTISCSKDDTKLNDTTIYISSISGIGNFTYENGLLKSYGNRSFIYDNNKRLLGYRIYGIQTLYGDSSEHLEKYSYKWNNDHITEQYIDTMMNKSSIQNSLWTNELSVKYYYTGERLDSIDNILSLYDPDFYKMVFEYDNNGNIKKTIEYYHPHFTSYIPVIITEYIEYDHMNNPYNIIFKQYKVILPQLYKENFSQNNPLSFKRKTRISQDGTNYNWIDESYSFNYKYNLKMFPTETKLIKGSIELMTKTIEYK